MKFNNFASSSLVQACLTSLLFLLIMFTNVSAVELTGSPAQVGEKSAAYIDDENFIA